MQWDELSGRITRSVGTPALVLAVVIIAGCGKSERASQPVMPQGAAARPAASAPQSKNGKATAPAADGMPNLKIVQKGITLRWLEKNRTGMAARARKFEGSEVTRKGVLVDFSAELYENGKLTTTLTAPRVVADEANRTLTAAGGVTLKSLERGTVVRAEWIRWLARQNKIVGNGGVKVVSNTQEGDRYEVEGAAFEADTALKTIKIMNSAKGLVRE
ncbi:MAG: hypothetical protein ACP5R5_00260 [Armatimonadota bacterium]